MPKRSGPPTEFSFESAYECLLRETRRRKKPVERDTSPATSVSLSDSLEPSDKWNGRSNLRGDLIAAEYERLERKRQRNGK